MPTHAEQRLLPYTPEQLFELVADVERYPEFLPWCVGARIRERTRRSHRRRSADRLQDGARALHLAGRCSTGPAASMSATAEGPFRYLDNHWLFEPQPDGGCIIDFYVDFEFRSRMLQKSSSCCSTRRCAAWSPPSRPAPASFTASRRPMAPGRRLRRAASARRASAEDHGPVADLACGRRGRRSARNARHSSWRGRDERGRPVSRRAAARAGDAGDRNGEIDPGACASAPLAIASAISALTAPCAAMASAGTPSSSVFASFE